MQSNSENKLWTLFITFFKMALFTIGGGYAMLPVMEDEFVKKKKWIKAEDIVDVMAIVQSVPGIIAVNASVFVGYRVAGVLGAFAASIGVVAPSFIIIVIIAAFLKTIGGENLLESAFIGVRSGVCALILLAALNLGKKVIKGKFAWIMAVAAFLGIIIFKINIVFMIVAGGIIGIIWYSFNFRKMFSRQNMEEG